MAEHWANTTPARRTRRLAQSVGAAIVMLAGPPALARVAVVSQDDGSVSDINTDANTLAATIKLDKGPAGIAASPDGRTLYVTYPDSARLAIIDAIRGRLLRYLPFAGQPFGVVAGDGVAYVSDWSKNTVTRLRIGSNASEQRVAVGRSPAELALDAPGHRLYVADRESGTVTVIDTAHMRAIAAIPSGSAPYALALSPDRQRLYVANVRSGDLAVIDTANLLCVARIHVGSMPYGVAVTPDGGSILVTLQHGDRVSIYHARTLALAGSIKVGRYPEGIVAVGNSRAYVANWFSGDVSILDLPARREIARLKIGDGPRSLAVIADAHGS